MSTPQMEMAPPTGATSEHTTHANSTCDAPDSAALPAWWPSATLTRLTTTNPRIVTKSFALDENGVLTKTTVANVTKGRVDRVQVADLQDLADVLSGLTHDQCLIFGIAPADSLELVTNDEWVLAGQPANQVARTKEAYRWPEGPGILMLDYDPLGDGDALPPENLVDAVRGACPGLADVEMLWWSSASSCIVNTITGERLRGIRGQRLYLMVADASDIPRAGKALCERLWAAGYGCFAISGAGSLLERALFDTSVWQPNRIDFAAGARCFPPLQQQRGDPVLIPGGKQRVDTVQAIPEPDAATLALAEKRKADARRLRQSEAEQVKAAWSAERVKVMAPRIAHDEGIPIEQATQRAQRTVDQATSEHMELLEDWPLMVKAPEGNEVTVTVGQVLKARERWEGCITKDPIESDYDGGRWVGKMYLTGGHPSLHSQAHGGRTYRLIEEHNLKGLFPVVVPSRQGSDFVGVGISDLHTFAPTPPMFWTEEMLPAGVVTLLGAHGGTGKTTMALNWAVCLAMGLPFLGKPTTAANVIFYSAEDDAEMLRWRLATICRRLGVDPVELAKRLTVVDASDAETGLYVEAMRAGVKAGEPTAAFAGMVKMMTAHGAQIVILDNASDVYAADENNRAQVRSFIRYLNRLIRPMKGAVLLLAHVDKLTARTGGTQGYSGSTAWHNSVRSRLFLSEDSTGRLTLEHQKSNRGKKADPMTLRFDDGMIVLATSGVGKGAAPASGDLIYLEPLLTALEEFFERGEYVSTSSTAHTNAFKMLGGERGLTGLRKSDFWHLIREAERNGLIFREPYRTGQRKHAERWRVGQSGTPSAPSAPSAPSFNESAPVQ